MIHTGVKGSISVILIRLSRLTLEYSTTTLLLIPILSQANCPTESTPGKKVIGKVALSGSLEVFFR